MLFRIGIPCAKRGLPSALTYGDMPEPKNVPDFD
jgi:hypothetical protein